MSDEKTFRNLKQVSVYLRGKGYKTSKTQIYEHGKARKIRPRDDGKYYLLDVEQYAADYLKSKNTPPQSSDVTQRRRNEAEAKKLEAQAKHWQIKAKVAEGAYVEKEAFEKALTYRSLLFKQDLEHFARAQAPEICRLVNGDENRIPDLIEYLLNQFALFLNRYAEDREFIVPAPMNTGQDDLDNDEKENNADFLENAEETDNI